jgi:hypothetical protein
MAVKIDTPWGVVTEWARRQAAINMRNDPAKFEQVVQCFVRGQGMTREQAVATMRERYPEAFEGGPTDA